MNICTYILSLRTPSKTELVDLISTDVLLSIGTLPTIKRIMLLNSKINPKKIGRLILSGDLNSSTSGTTKNHSFGKTTLGNTRVKMLCLFQNC